MIRAAPGPAEVAKRRRSKAQIANATTAVAPAPTIKSRGASPGSRPSGTTEGRGAPPSTTRGCGRPASTAGRVDVVTACRARAFGRRSDAPPFEMPWDAAARARLSATRPWAASLVASCAAGSASATGACCTASLESPPASAEVAAPRAVGPALADATGCDVDGRHGARSGSPVPEAGGAADGADAGGGGGSFVAGGGATGAASARGRNKSGSR
jgi:hypothetical protein